jgi:hypothetical protein
MAKLREAATLSALIVVCAGPRGQSGRNHPVSNPRAINGNPTNRAQSLPDPMAFLRAWALPLGRRDVSGRETLAQAPLALLSFATRRERCRATRRRGPGSGLCVAC